MKFGIWLGKWVVRVLIVWPSDLLFGLLPFLRPPVIRFGGWCNRKLEGWLKRSGVDVCEHGYAQIRPDSCPHCHPLSKAAK